MRDDLPESVLQRLPESPRTAEGIELVRNVAKRMLPELIEADLSGRIAQQNEHNDAPTDFRNSHREKTLATQVGTSEASTQPS